MKLVYSCVYATGSKAPGKEGPVILSSAAELTSFGYFQRSSVKEMFVFFSRTFAKNVKPGQRTSVKHEAYLCHMYCSPGGAPDPRAAVELEQPTKSRPASSTLSRSHLRRCHRRVLCGRGVPVARGLWIPIQAVRRFHPGHGRPARQLR